MNQIKQVKTPKKKQLYDVHELKSVLGIVYHIRAVHYNIPAAMASYYVKTLACTSGNFYIYVKNGLKPLDVLRERKVKQLQLVNLN